MIRVTDDELGRISSEAELLAVRISEAKGSPKSLKNLEHK
jgi:hypothetical protein